MPLCVRSLCNILLKLQVPAKFDVSQLLKADCQPCLQNMHGIFGCSHASCFKDLHAHKIPFVLLTVVCDAQYKASFALKRSITAECPLLQATSTGATIAASVQQDPCAADEPDTGVMRLWKFASWLGYYLRKAATYCAAAMVVFVILSCETTAGLLWIFGRHQEREELLVSQLTLCVG